MRALRYHTILSNYSAQLSVLLLNMVYLIFITRLLGVKDFGALGQVTAAASTAMLFLSFNFGHGFLRFASNTDLDERRAYFWASLTSLIAIHLVVFFLLLPYAHQVSAALIDISDVMPFAIIVLLSLLANVQNQLRKYLIASGRAFLAGLYGSISPFVVYSSALSCAYFFGGLSGTLWGLVAGRTIENLLLFKVAGVKTLFPFSFDFTKFKKLVVFCAPLFPMAISYWTCNVSSRFMIKYFHGLDVVGYYNVVYFLPSTLPLLFSSLSPIFLSSLVRLYDRGNMSQVSWWVSTAIRAFIILGLAAVGFMYSSGSELIKLLAGQDYVFSDCARVLLILGIGNILFGLLDIYNRIYDLQKNTWAISRGWIAAALIVFSLNVLLIPRYGLTGAALSMAVGYACALFLSAKCVPVFLTLDIRPLKIFFYSALCLGVFGPLKFLVSIMGIIGIVIVAICTIGVILSSFPLGLLDRGEIFESIGLSSQGK